MRYNRCVRMLELNPNSLARKDEEAISELQTLKEKLADVSAELEKLKKAPVSAASRLAVLIYSIQILH